MTSHTTSTQAKSVSLRYNLDNRSGDSHFFPETMAIMSLFLSDCHL